MKIDFKRIDHVMLCFPEGREKEARRFYEEVLGLEEIIDPERPHLRGAIWYQMGNIQLHLMTDQGSNASARHPAFEVTNLEECRQLLESHGIPVKNLTPIIGRTRFSFRDPFENRIELLQYHD